MDQTDQSKSGINVSLYWFTSMCRLFIKNTMGLTSNLCTPLLRFYLLRQYIPNKRKCIIRFPFYMVCHVLTFVLITSYFHLLAGDISINSGPAISHNIRFATTNVQSVQGKMASLSDLLFSKKIDITKI